nr:MAG TPA: hypothetical protein [Caudoviricetes sp.]
MDKPLNKSSFLVITFLRHYTTLHFVNCQDIL